MKKLICLITALVLLTSFAALGEEQPVKSVIYAKVTPPSGGSANLYVLPGDYRPVTATLPSGTQVFVEFEGSTWHKVRSVTGNNVGWIKASDLTITSRGLSAVNYGSTVTGVKSISSSDGLAALRWGPGLEYDKMGDLTNGSYVWQFDVCDDWTRVLTSDGYIGYVHSTLLKNASASAAQFPGVYGYVQVAGGSAVYRKSASYSSTALNTMPSGEVIEILGLSGNFWYFYSAQRNVYAYISQDIVSPGGINRTESLCALYYDNPYVYYTDTLTTLQPGQTVKVLATDGYISRIQYENFIGYAVNNTLVIK